MLLLLFLPLALAQTQGSCCIQYTLVEGGFQGAACFEFVTLEQCGDDFPAVPGTVKETLWSNQPCEELVVENPEQCGQPPDDEGCCSWLPTVADPMSTRTFMKSP